MRDVPANLQATLDSGASTLARCWAITRRDGLTLGFTDHDRDLFFEGISFEPDSGFTRSAVESSTGLAVDTHSISGALQSPRITELDIRKRLYDGAEVVLYLVDWTEVSTRLLLTRGSIGEIRWQGSAFEAEITGLSDNLNVSFGRTFIHSCNCAPGSPACGFATSAPENNASATVTAVSGFQRMTVSGIEDFDEGLFAGGLLTWTSGANEGSEAHVKAHFSSGGEAVIELWIAPALAVNSGDQFTLAAGCTKTAEGFLERFGDLTDYRGFPHIPGNDFASSYPNTGGAHDGGSLFRR